MDQMANIRTSLLLQGMKSRIPEKFEDHPVHDPSSRLASYFNNFSKHYEFSIASPRNINNDKAESSRQINPLVEEESKVSSKKVTPNKEIEID